MTVAEDKLMPSFAMRCKRKEKRTSSCKNVRYLNEYFVLYQFLSEWMGAGILPPRAIKRAQLSFFSGIMGA